MMRRLPLLLAPMVAAALALGSCGDDTSSTPTSTTSTSTTTTSATTSTSSTTSTTSTSTTTTAPVPDCDPTDVVAVIDDALTTARLTAPSAWEAEPAATPFAERTATGDLYADLTGLDCGLLLAAADDSGRWLAVTAWTGPRLVFAVQTTAVPSAAYSTTAIVRTPVADLAGEYLADDMSRWAATGPDGESIVIGHVDYAFGPAAKNWDAGPWDFFEPEINVPAERHALDALEAAGMRNVGIAQPSEVGSEEGYAQFVSPSGQISVADVAPTGWFDPMAPRYYTGETTIESIDGAEVRVTLPNPDDNAGFIPAAEVAFACDGFAWILEPPFNGTIDEMVDSATAILATDECRS